MERIKLLSQDWAYPVCQHPTQLQININYITTHFQRSNGFGSVQFVSIGTSGAMLLGALSARIFHGSQFRFILLRKGNDDTSQGRYHVDFNDTPIVIIDDHIHNGFTMKKISDQLTDKKVVDQVIGVIARCWDENDPEYVSKNQDAIVGNFPKVKFWIY